MIHIMKIEALKNTIQQLLSGSKGLLAMDESTTTCNKRFEPLDIPQTVEYRKKYRELIVTTPGLEAYISGAILVDETITQRTAAGKLFTEILTAKGIIPGIKVDQGTVPMEGCPGERLTEGLEGLAERLAHYYSLGARFAKWRAVITIGENTPTATNIRANADLLARYALLCQEAGLVPIVEPEILMDGDHSLQRCAEVTREVLHTVFNSLLERQVHLEGMILKPNMIVPGTHSAVQDNIAAVADATVECLLQYVPASAPGIAFLSGGQPAELATARLNEMHLRFKNKMPWVLTFSFSRAVQQPALEFWKGDDRNVQGAQQRLLHRVDLNSAALTGRYTAGMENTLNGAF
jgi:fructose-bisphosphate aldolase class I